MKPQFRALAGFSLNEIKDPFTQRLVRAIENQIRATLDQFGKADASGLIGPIAIGTVETRISHGLTSVPTGWEVVSPQASATVWQSKAPDATYLYLIASSAVTALVRVF